MQETKEVEKIALFVDVENLIGFSNDLGLPIDLAPIIKKLTETGRVLFRRSFGDLSKSLDATGQFNRLNHVRQMLQRNLVQHEDVPYDGKYKNSSDIRLAVEALSIAFNYPAITTLAIVSSDRDYIPLFAKLRELGKNVTGISGNPSTVSERYITACDAIFYVEDLYRVESGMLADVPGKQGDTAEPVPTSYLRDQYRELLVRAIISLSERGRQTLGAVIVPMMRQMQPDFDVNRAGFASFKEFVGFAEKSGSVSVRWQGYDILVTLPTSTTNDSAIKNLTEPAKLGSVEEYRRFVEGKLRVPLPYRDLRFRIYNTAIEAVNEAEDFAGISLNDLSQDVADKLVEDGTTLTKSAVFKLLYSVYRAGCFIVEPGPITYDPQILGVIDQNTEKWDDKFVGNMLLLMSKELRGTPLIVNTLSTLFFDNEEGVDLIAKRLKELNVEPAKG